MFISIVLSVICIVLLIPAFFVCLYYNFLAVLSLIPEGKEEFTESENKLKFIIVIPAHNEELIIEKTLTSCTEIDYPVDQYKVIVVADNCTDSTNEKVVQSGFTCMERRDKVKMGKGFALQWFFENFKEVYDAVLVLDADCIIDKNTLKTFNNYFNRGYDALQANDISSNPDESAISYFVSVGNFIENDFFYVPKSRLGLAVFLRGTGFALKKNVLDQYPWDAHSIVEDMEYSLNLLKGNMKIKFVKDIAVSSEFPSEENQFNVQRKRWGGNLGYGKTEGIRLFCEGVAKKNPVLMDAGITILTLSRPLVIFELFLALAFCIVSYLILLNSLIYWLLIIALIITVIQCCYFGIGIMVMGITIKRIRYLLKAPLILLKLVFISVLSLSGLNNEKWEKTPR